MWNMLASKGNDKVTMKKSRKMKGWGPMKYKCGIFGIKSGSPMVVLMFTQIMRYSLEKKLECHLSSKRGKTESWTVLEKLDSTFSRTQGTK